MRWIHEIQAGIKCFFVCSVYGLAPGIGPGEGILEAVFDCGDEVTLQDFFAREEFLNMNPACRASRQLCSSAWKEAPVGRKVRDLGAKDGSQMVAIISAAMFLTGEGHDHRGRFLGDVLALDDSSLERSHDYIQWLFPLPEASRFSASAPMLSHEDIALIRASAAARANLLRARDRMLAFYRGNDHWQVPFDHNHLRITRIIRCLALCLGEEEAGSFHEEILALVEAAGNPVNRESLRYWRDAVSGPRTKSFGGY